MTQRSIMRTHGRAYPISRNDVRSYDRTAPPRRYSPNPIGVTTLASINDRGAYGRSAHDTMRGMSPNDRYGYARTAVRGDPMRNPPRRPPTGRESRAYKRGHGRTFAKKRKAAPKKKAARKTTPRRSKAADTKRRATRETAYRRLRREGLADKKAASRAMREVPFLKSQRARTFHGTKAFTGKATRRKTPRQYAKRTVKVTKRVPTTRRVTTTKTRRTRVAFGKFKRLWVKDPRTGRRKLSYLYKDPKTGRRRKIPTWAIAGAPSASAYKDSRYDKPRARTQKRRASASRSVTRRGGVFTPNRKKKRKTKMAKSTKRSRAAKKGWATRRRKTSTRRVAAKKGRRTYRRKKTTRKKTKRKKTSRKNRARRSTTALVPNRRKRRKKTARKTRRRTRRNPARKATTARRSAATPNRRKRRTKRNARKATPNRSRSAAAKLGWKRRKARKGARVGKGRGRGGVALQRGKVYYKGKKKPRRLKGVHARRLPKARVYLTNRRRKRKATKRRGGRRRTYRRNQFMSTFRDGLNTAVFVTTGFVGHKALTHVICAKMLLPMLEKKGTAAPNGAPNGNAVQGLGQTNGNGTLKKLLPLLCGGVVAAGGIFVASKITSRKRTIELGAGMLTSFLHTALVTVLDMSDASRKALPYVSGYDTQSTAAAIGRFRRNRISGMRGLGQQGPSTSILPQYAPTGQPGGIQQAVAMAGRGGRMGEYFQTSGVGEYFASGVQGIGQYEPAGPMVTQAAAGLGQQIDNGILPNQADAALTLAEAQAGTGASMMGVGGGRGMGRTRGTGRLGEYYSARPDNGQWSQYRVPTSNTWVPGDTNPELWAGTKPAQDALQTSEIPAGVLESASGNGIF